MFGVQFCCWLWLVMMGWIWLWYCVQQLFGVFVFWIVEDFFIVVLFNNGIGKYNCYLVGEVFDY